jgi:hypothetical protein
VNGGQPRTKTDVSPHTVVGLILAGAITPVKYSRGGYPLFDPEDPKVVAWLKVVRSAGRPTTSM